MADTQFYTIEAAFTLATEVKTALAASKLRLCQTPFVATPTSTKAEMVAAEATFDGYTAGGYALAAYIGPGFADGGGAKITSPLASPAYGPAGAPPVTNEISSWWIEDASGDVRVAGVFNPVRPMATVGDILEFVAQLVLGRNAIAV